MTNNIENVMVGIAKSLNEEHNTVRCKRLATYGRENFEALCLALHAARGTAMKEAETGEKAMPNVADLIKGARGTDDSHRNEESLKDAAISEKQSGGGFLGLFKKNKDRQ